MQTQGEAVQTQGEAVQTQGEAVKVDGACSLTSIWTRASAPVSMAGCPLIVLHRFKAVLKGSEATRKGTEKTG